MRYIQCGVGVIFHKNATWEEAERERHAARLKHTNLEKSQIEL